MLILMEFVALDLGMNVRKIGNLNLPHKEKNSHAQSPILPSKKNAVLGFLRLHVPHIRFLHISPSVSLVYLSATQFEYLFALHL